jgi:hypothetical protein
MVHTSKMDNLILKTMILILTDKDTGKPVVVTHFHGFDNEDEAIQFSDFLKNNLLMNLKFQKKPFTRGVLF